MLTLFYQPFTHDFPRADIYELLAPDLLHQLIKGMFKDHLVTWIMDYLHVIHGETAAFEIIEDIDHRFVMSKIFLSRNSYFSCTRTGLYSISAVPPFPGLRRFPDGRDYSQWTGDDSKALMKACRVSWPFCSQTYILAVQVFLAAIAGYIPSAMVQSIATFMNACYIARRNTITAPALKHFHESVKRFHELRNIFIETGVRDSISLPRQHALKHFYKSIHFFGSPNGLCSSITESKHIKAVKEPWRRSNRYRALIQMLRVIVRMEKLTALRRIFSDNGMLIGTTSSYMAGIASVQDSEDQNEALDTSDEEDEEGDGGPITGDPTSALFVVNLATKSRAFDAVIKALKLMF